MGRLEFESLGSATVKRVTAKAVLVELHDRDTDTAWIPLSVLATDCAAQCRDGWVYDRLRVESWFAAKEEVA